MELKIAQVEIPEIIDFNYEELKNEISAKAHEYEVMVYTDDKIKEAKADKAALNKLKKTLNDERIKQEKEYMKPFEEFKNRVNEIIGIVDKPIAVIDTQVKEYESRKQQEKKRSIEDIWSELEKPEFITLGMIWNPKWLNSTFSIKKVCEEMQERLDGIRADITTLKNLDEFSFEALEHYKTTLDLGESIAEGQRLAAIQKAKEEFARKKAEEAKRAAQEAEKPIFDSTAAEIPYQKPERMVEPPVPSESEGQWIAFKAFLTVEQAIKLKQFFDDNNITFSKA